MTFLSLLVQSLVDEVIKFTSHNLCSTSVLLFLMGSRTSPVQVYKGRNFPCTYLWKACLEALNLKPLFITVTAMAHKKIMVAATREEGMRSVTKDESKKGVYFDPNSHAGKNTRKWSKINVVCASVIGYIFMFGKAQSEGSIYHYNF